MKKKLVSLFLAVCISFTMFTPSIYAEVETTGIEAVDNDVDESIQEGQIEDNTENPDEVNNNTEDNISTQDTDSKIQVYSSGKMTLSELRNKFPAGKYWNHAGNPGSSNSKNNQDGYTSTPCPKHGNVGTSSQTCNGFAPDGTQLSWQCMGYAEKLGYDVTGFNPRNNSNGWTTSTNSSALDNLKAGDIVRYKNNGHSIYVTAVNGDTVTYTDCNSDNHCVIRWDQQISKSTLRSSFTHVRSAPTEVVDKQDPDPVTSAPDIWKNSDNYVVGDAAKFTWNSVDNATGYWFSIWYKGEQIVSTGVDGNSEYTFYNLKEGEYTAFIKAYNDVSSMENSISLTVNYSTGYDAISNGKYQICTALDNSSVVSVIGGSDNNEANVILYANENHKNQIFDFEYLGDGYYKITAESSKKCLDVHNSENTDGANVEQYEWHDGENQKWIVKEAGDGYFYIVSKANGLYLDVYGGEAKNDANIDTYSGHGGASEKWKLIPCIDGEQTIKDGVYGIQSVSDNQYWVNVKDNSQDDEANIQLGTEKATFQFTYLDDGSYKIANTNSEKYLDAYSADEMKGKKRGTNVQQYRWKGGDNQKWIIQSAGDGQYYLICKSNAFYLDVYGGKPENGTNLDVWTGNGYKGQRWLLVPEEKDPSGECGKDVTWTLDKSGRLSISGSGAMKNYTAKSEVPWYQYIDRIQSVVIEDGVTTIGDYAFYGLTEATEIKIPEGVKTIGAYAFKNSTKVADVKLPDTLTKLGESAFYGCTSLNKMTIPEGLYTIWGYTFKNCTSLSEVNLPNSLIKIDEAAFYGCTSLKSITIPDKVTIVGIYCFKNCSNLSEVNLPEGITKIREAAFYNTAITELTIPDSVTAVGEYAFKNCVKLKEIQFSKEIKTIGESAFYACSSLNKLVFPSNLTTIGDYAFRKCTNLQAIEFSDTLEKIGESAFYGCSELSELMLPEGLTDIGAYAFKSCTNVAAITFPSTLNVIGESGFYGCTKIKSIEIPASVKEIRDYAFSRCTGLGTIKFKGDAPEIAEHAFNKVTADASYGTKNSTWTEEKKQNYGGTLTWSKEAEPGTETHNFEETSRDLEYIHYTCKDCGETKEEFNDQTYTIDLGDGKSTTVVGHFDLDMRREIFLLVNQKRTTVGVNPIKLASDSSPLQDVANIRAYEITNSYSHIRPNGERAITSFSAYAATAGENLAKGFYSAEDVCNAWFSSSTHNQNITNNGYQSIGIGVFCKKSEDGSYHNYFSQMFSNADYSND